MRILALVVLLSVVPVRAQDLAPGHEELARLRAVIEASDGGVDAIAIAVVDGGRPVIVCHGNDTGGAPIGSLTYTPVGSLVRVILADALDVESDGKLDTPAGVEIGGAEPTLLELLQGHPLLPDYWDWREDSDPVPAEALLACADVAAEAGFEFGRRKTGMAGFVLLERSPLMADVPDWSSFLRRTLSPHCSGLDPIDAAHPTAGETDVSILSMVAEHARPAPLRLMFRVRDLGGWWQWRVGAARPLWEGFRIAFRGKATRREEIIAWRAGSDWSHPVHDLALIYPQHRSGVLCIAVGSREQAADRVRKAVQVFEADLFGELPPRGAGGVFGARGGRSAPLADWSGKTWKTNPGADAPCEIHIENGEHSGLNLTSQGRTYGSSQVLREGRAKRVVLDLGGRHGSGVLWLHPRPGTADPRHLTAVFVEHRARYKVPHLIDLELQERAPR